MLQIVLYVCKHGTNSNVLFKLTSVNDFSLDEVPVSPTGQFQQSRESFYVTDSHLSVTNIAQMAM